MRPIYHGKDRAHTTQKPTQLFAELVAIHTNPGDTVLDPYLGSGTTAVAAAAARRNFIGCDLDPLFTDFAQARVSGDTQRVAQLKADIKKRRTLEMATQRPAA
ncbi:hypothetical protein CKO28_06140 [Rhodovibrio sodomensis]|uniref:site-specific DNA-methyltransferase (adenine-specific) n=2 Tax=Rhodovibrio sodomensis TaxID=1088 RepID=A0ABS1DCF0_9PROT|nr:hypothetical protein [Rhodovibrio sodomensis]